MRIKRNWLLYSGIFLLLMHFYISFSDLLKFAEGISKPILFIGLLLLIVSSYIKKNKIVLKTVAYLFAFVMYYYSKQSDILQFIIIVTSLQDEDIKSIVKFVFKISSVLLLVHIILYFFLYAYNNAIVHFNFRNKLNVIEVRHTFLFSHSNIFSAILCWWYLSYLYIRGNEKLLKRIIILLGVSLLIILFSKTRTALIIIYSTLLIIPIYKKKGKTALKKIVKHSIELLSIIFISFIFLYPNSRIIQSFDSILEARIKLGYVAKEKFGIKLLGQNIEYNETDDYYLRYGLSNTGITLDSTIYKILLSDGIICFVLFMFYVFSRCKKIDDDNEKNCFILSFALFSVVESFGLYPLLAFPILLLGEKDN